MKHFIFYLITALFLIIFANSAHAYEQNNSRFFHSDEFIVWHNNFSGYLSLNKPRYNLQTNFANDGNFIKKNAVGFSWFFRSGGRAESYLSFMQLEHSSDINARGDLNDIEFDGRKFNVDNGLARVNFRLKIDVFDFMVIRRLKYRPWGQLNFIYGFRTLQADMVIKDMNSPVSASYSKVLPLPNFGFDINYDVSERIKGHGLISGFALRREDNGGKFNNLDLSLEYDFMCEEKTGFNAACSIGYKEQYIEADISRNRYSVRHNGPIFKFSAKF